LTGGRVIREPSEDGVHRVQHHVLRAGRIHLVSDPGEQILDVIAPELAREHGLAAAGCADDKRGTALRQTPRLTWSNPRMPVGSFGTDPVPDTGA